jgi:hypothetical protein
MVFHELLWNLNGTVSIRALASSTLRFMTLLTRAVSPDTNPFAIEDEDSYESSAIRRQHTAVRGRTAAGARKLKELQPKHMYKNNVILSTAIDPIARTHGPCP